eukprot:2736844-Pleurochrysis_carterae.AAC.4
MEQQGASYRTFQAIQEVYETIFHFHHSRKLQLRLNMRFPFVHAPKSSAGMSALSNTTIFLARKLIALRIPAPGSQPSIARYKGLGQPKLYTSHYHTRFNHWPSLYSLHMASRKRRSSASSLAKPTRACINGCVESKSGRRSSHSSARAIVLGSLFAAASSRCVAISCVWPMIALLRAQGELPCSLQRPGRSSSMPGRSKDVRFHGLGDADI